MDRKDQFIQALCSVGGKTFCWHDWTFLGYVPSLLSRCSVGCVKCGKMTYFNKPPSEIEYHD